MKPIKLGIMVVKLPLRVYTGEAIRKFAVIKESAKKIKTIVEITAGKEKEKILFFYILLKQRIKRFLHVNL